MPSLFICCWGLWGFQCSPAFRAASALCWAPPAVTSSAFLGSALVYWLLTALVKDTLPVRITACLLGLIVCYAFGTAWFMAVYTAGPMDVGAAVAMCVIPFILPDLVKIGLAVTLAQRVRKYLK